MALLTMFTEMIFFFVLKILNDLKTVEKQNWFRSNKFLKIWSRQQRCAVSSLTQLGRFSFDTRCQICHLFLDQHEIFCCFRQGWVVKCLIINMST